MLLVPPKELPGARSLPAPPEHHKLIERPAELDAVRKKLAGTDGGANVGITSLPFTNVGLPGMPGLGKTVLLALVMNDPWVHGMVCPDGAVVIDFGEERGAESALNELLRALRHGLADELLEALDELLEEKGIRSLVDAVKKAVDGRRILVGLDDVWKKKEHPRRRPS